MKSLVCNSLLETPSYKEVRRRGNSTGKGNFNTSCSLFGYQPAEVREVHSWGGFSPGMQILYFCHLQKPLKSTLSLQIAVRKSPLMIRIRCSTSLKFKLRDPSLGFLFLFRQAQKSFCFVAAGLWTSRNRKKLKDRTFQVQVTHNYFYLHSNMSKRGFAPNSSLQYLCTFQVYNWIRLL